MTGKIPASCDGGWNGAYPWGCDKNLPNKSICVLASVFMMTNSKLVTCKLTVLYFS
jgi:hypothetical protein